MRLVTWNCRGAFARKGDVAASLRPDVLVVPECEKPASLQQPLHSPPIRSIEWFGNNPRKGLAVMSYGDYSLKVHPSYDPRHQWIAPLLVSGPREFLLFGVWTLPIGSRSGCYNRPLFEAFESYKSLMVDFDVVWAGDFNANVVWDKPSAQHKFRDFVSLLSQHQLRSLYHHHRKCEHGEEPDPTFYLYSHEEKGHHIDYVFASDRLHREGLRVSVGAHAEWSQHSDHSPLVCELSAPRKVE